MSRTAIAWAATVLFFAASSGANAADCFDRRTDNPKAGNATAVAGPEVGLLRDRGADFARPVSGDDVFSGDRVRTGAGSHFQLKLCDWSTYTFAPESESTINEFYDSGGLRRRRLVNFVRGGFRLSSGRKSKPGATEVEIQESGVTMGVRGTNVILVELDGLIYALLEGPARGNSGLTPQGRVDFWTGENREAILASLTRPGFAVTIGPDGVSRPFRAGADLLQRIYAAFAPAAPESLDASGGLAGVSAGGDSGQGAQDGGARAAATELADTFADDATEGQPEQPFGAAPIAIGDILPLDALEQIAAAQTNPDGVILALASARLVVQGGPAGTVTENGVALIQIHVDWANRTIAPEALASFAVLDFSVIDPSDLTIESTAAGAQLGPEVMDAYINAVLASNNLPFASGANGLAVFTAPIFTFTVRQGPGGTVTVDVDATFNTTSNQGDMVTATAEFRDLVLAPGAGDLSFFARELAEVDSIAELSAFAPAGTTIIADAVSFAISTLGTPTELNGVSYGQLEINFTNRTIGGPASFLAITAAADPAIGGVKATEYIALNQPVSFDSGLFNLAFYPLALLTADPALVKGQALIGDNIGEVNGDITVIFETDNGSHLFTDFELEEGNFAGLPIATITGLDANTPADFIAMGIPAGLVGGTLHYDGTIASGNQGIAELDQGGPPLIGAAEASIDINFGNRTIGGGNSFVSVNIPAFPGGPTVLNFTETLAAVSFDDGANGAGVFGFDGGDFSGGNIDSALLLIRNDPQFTGVGERADLFFNFNDGAGGVGDGEIENMPLQGAGTP